MAAPSETLNILQKYRQNNPARFSTWSDERLYRYLEGKNEIPQSAVWQEKTSRFKPKQELTQQENPSQELSFFASGLDWGVNEDSWEWTKAAYNRSLTGSVEQLVTGKSRYDVDESDFTVWEDIGASIFSFFMPLDILTMGVGGKIGGGLAKGALKTGLFGNGMKKAAQKAAKEGVDIFADKGVGKILANSKFQKAMIGGIRQAPALGLYEGAMYGVQAKINGEDVWPAIGEGVMHGSILGFLTGAAGGGMGAKQAEILSKSKDGKTILSKYDKFRAFGMYGMPGQIGVESGIFTVAEYAPKIAAGEDIRGEEFLTSFAKNVGLFTGLKTIGKVQNKFWEQSSKIIDETRKASKDKKDKTDEALENVDKTYEETMGDRSEAVAQEKSQSSSKDTAKQESLVELKKSIDEIVDIKNSGNPDKIDGKAVAKINNSLAEIIDNIERIDGKTPFQEQLLKQAKAEKESLETQFDKWLDSGGKKTEVTEIIETPPEKKTPVPEKPLKEMLEPELIKEGERVLGKSEKQIKEEYKGKILDPNEKPILQKEKLIQDIKVKKEEAIEKEIGSKLKSPEEHYKEKEGDKTLPERESVLDKVAKITQHLDTKGIKESNYKDFERPLKESYYDIQEIGQNKFAQETRLSKSKTKKGEKRLVETGQDIGYIDIYLKFAKELAKDGKSLRDATYNDVVKFISRNEGSQNALKIFYSHLNALGKVRQESLKAEIPELQKIAGVAPRVDKGLRTGRIDIETGEVRYIQSKTLGAKEISLGDRLKGLFKKILGKTKLTDEAGDTVFRDINNKALTKTQQTNLIKRFFGDVKNYDLRSAFSQYIAKKYGYKSSEWALINELGLGHTKKTIEKAYLKEMTMKEDFKKLQKEFIELIEGKGRLKFEYEGKTLDFETPYPKGGGLNIQQIRDAYKKISLSDKVIKVGNSEISRDTAEAMIRFMIENAPRPGEAVPQKVADVVFKRFIPKFTKESETIQYQVNKFKEKLDTDRAEQQTYKDYFEKIPQYKELKIKLGKELGVKGGERVLGQIEGHIIKIAKGKVKADTIPHEVSHYVVNVLNKFGTSKAKSLIQRGTKMFGSEESLVQRIGEYAQGQIKDRTLLSKAKNWVRAFNAHVKEFLGLSNKEDIAFIMSRRVVKGNIPHGVKVKNYINKLKTEYQRVPFKHSGALYGQIKSFEKQLRENNLMTQKEINSIREKYDIPLEGSGQGRASLDSLNPYADYIHEIKTRRENTQDRLEALRIEKGFKKAEAESIARALGSIDGKIKNLTPKNRIIFEEIINQEGIKESKVPTASDHIDGINAKLTYHQKLARTILPVYEFLQKYGGGPGRFIKDNIMYHESYNTRLQGKGQEGKKLIEEALGKNKYKIFKKHSSIFDTERFENYLKAFESKDGKDGVGVKEKWTKPTDKEIQFFENTKKEGTPEHSAKKIWGELRQGYWNKTKEEARKINNRAEYEIFEKEFNDKFVNDYFTRRLTKEAYQYLIESGNLDKLANKNLKKVAKAKAKEEAGKNASPEKIKELTEKYMNDKNLETEIYTDLYHYLRQDHKEIKNSFLLERGLILPEFMVIKRQGSGLNKLIRTYEKSEAGTIDAYIDGMSKHIATIRHFPDYSGMGGKYKLGKTPADIARLAGKDKVLREFAERAIEEITGTGGRTSLHKEGHSIASSFAHISAFMGLSSPTSGIKNFLIGMPRSIASFGFFNTARGFSKLFNANTWKEARRKGILEFGARTLSLKEGPKVLGKTMEDAFRWNLMTRTENFNRIVSMEAGKLYFQSQINALQGNGFLAGMGKKNANRLMRDMWQLSEKDIKFLEKFDITNKEQASKFNEILSHIEQTSHISAQGGTSVGRLPLWMSKKYGRPLTLFKRMAYSTTFDSVKNYYIPAIKHRNFAPLAKALGAHFVSGVALYGLYDALFDTEPPKSASKGLDKMNMYLWRSEFLGLFSELIGPYNKGIAESIFEPVIFRNLMEGKKQFQRWYFGEEFAGDAAHNFFKRSFVAYSQYDTMRKKAGGSGGWSNSDYTNGRKINNWEGQFRDTYVERRGSVEYWGKRTPYHRNLKESLYTGNEELMAKEFYKAYNYIVTELEDRYAKAGIKRNWRENHKDAIKALKSSIKTMQPGNIFSENDKGQSTSYKGQFYKWVNQNFGEKGMYSLRKSEKFYESSFDKLNKISGKYWDKYSVYGGQDKLSTKISK